MRENRNEKLCVQWCWALLGKAVLFVVSLMPLITVSETWTDKDNKTWEYTVSGGKATIIDCKSLLEGTVTIPEKLNGIPVVKVGDYAYSGSKYLTGLIIPDCITELGLSVFENCTALNNVVLGAGLKSVASTTFMGCTSIKSVKFGSFPSVLNADAITGDWVESGKDEATWTIYRCPSVPARGKAVMKRQIVNDGYADRMFFFRCKVSKLSQEVNLEFQIDGVRQKYLGGNDNEWYDVDIEVPLGSHILTWVYTVNGSSAAGGNAWISLSTVKTTTSASSAMAIFPDVYTKIEKVEFAPNVTAIPDYMFNKCEKLKSVLIPSSVREIGAVAFYECNSLGTITIPAGVRIGTVAFGICHSLNTIYFEGGASFDYPAPFPLDHEIVAYVRRGVNISWLSSLDRIIVKDYVYRVALVDEGGTTPLSEIIIDGGKPYGTLPALERTGYSFDGWYTAQKGGVKVLESDIPTADVTLYARWTPKQYIIRFHANDGSDTFVDQPFEYGGEVTLAKSGFFRSGYIFGGWATNPDGEAVYVDGQTLEEMPVVQDGVVSLYAVWEEAVGLISNVEVFSGYPWKEVVIGYTICGSVDKSSPLEVVAVDNVNGKTYACNTLEGASAELGRHVIKWNASADGAKFNSHDVVFTVRILPPPPPPLYYVIDLSGGTEATNYPITKMDEAGSDKWSNAYKETKLVLRRIDPGSFMMLGQYAVTLTKPFYMGVFEVTQKQWELIMGTRPSYFGNDVYYARRPVEQISYDMVRGSVLGAGWPGSHAVDSDSFLGRLRAKTGLDFDLPTEAQWEYACRAGTTTDYNNGANCVNDSRNSDMNVLGRYKYNCSGTSESTCSTAGGTGYVGSYKANNWGLFDMHGNVSELCLDWGYGVPATTDPEGELSGSSRILRGGSWNYTAGDCKSSSRSGYNPSVGRNGSGLRLSLTLQDGGGVYAQGYGAECLAETSSASVAVDTTFVDGAKVTGVVDVSFGSVDNSGCSITANGEELVNCNTNGVVKWDRFVNGENELVYNSCVLMTSKFLASLSLDGDGDATVIGNETTGYLIRPSEGSAAVKTIIPQDVDAAKVTVEVTTKVATVKPNGAKVKVVVGNDDITGYLVIPESDGVMNIAAATVKEEIVKETLDPSKDAVIELNAANPRLITAPTRKGLTYTLFEGHALESLSKGDSKLGDGNSWKPTITVSGGDAGFYSIDVSK